LRDRVRADPEEAAQQIRGVAMALRHWFEIHELQDEQRRAGLLPADSKDRDFDKSLRILSISALPPQIVRLKRDSPMQTLHFMQDVYDDGTLRADPWRWWFAWVAIEMIARTGPDHDGKRIAAFVRDDGSLEPVRIAAPRWLAANPTRSLLVESALRDRIAAVFDDKADHGRATGRTLPERATAAVGDLRSVLVEAMAREAGSVAGAITLRLRERVERLL